MLLDAAAGQREGGGGQPVGLHGPHLDELLAAVEEVAEVPQFLGRERRDGEGHVLDETGQDAGVDGVGFGQLSVGLGEVPGAFGFDDGDFDAGLFEGESGGQLQTAGGLEDGADVGRPGGAGPEGVEQLAVAVGGVGHAEGVVGGQEADVECGLGDVDANEEGGHGGVGDGGSDRVMTAGRPNSCWRMRARGPGDRSRLWSTNHDGGPNYHTASEAKPGNGLTVAAVLPHPMLKWEPSGKSKIPARGGGFAKPLGSPRTKKRFELVGPPSHLQPRSGDRW